MPPRDPLLERINAVVEHGNAALAEINYRTRRNQRLEILNLLDEFDQAEEILE